MRFKTMFAPLMAPVVALLSLLLLTACEPAAKPMADKATAVGAEGGDKAPEAPAAPAADGNYTIETTAGELKAGEAGELQVKVKPAPGFKINEEYPWKATLTGDAILNPDKPELEQDAWGLSKHEATLKVPVQVKAAGDGKLTGKLSFSVCNDSACDVIRDKDISWSAAAK